MPLQKALSASVSGLSGTAARELAFRVLTPGCDRAEDLRETASRLAELIRRLPELADARVLTDEVGDPVDVFAFPYLSCDLRYQEPVPGISQALERYFGARDAKDRISQKSAAIVHLLKGHIDRCERKLALQEEELANAARMEEYRLMGELINANLWQLKKGPEQVELPNYYDENGGTVVIPLDTRLTPAQNAQRYFKRYQKARSARETAAEQKAKTVSELDYLEATLLDVGKCVAEAELEEIRADLMRTGYIRKPAARKERRALPQSRPYVYRSADGILIEVGKNAAQNDRLTTGADGDEMWLHAKDMPGSHVIIHHTGEVPQTTLKQAAQLACWYSKGQRSSGVPVDYTLRRYVKKPGGAAPGFVIYTHQHTAYMTVSEAEIRAIELVSE